MDRVMLGDGKIYCEVSQGDGLMVFTHGYWSNGSYFDHQRDYFSGQGYGTLLWDLPGLGGSERSFRKGDYSKEFFVDSLEQVILSACDPEEQRLVLVGHSMGSMVTMELAKRHPGWADAIVLVAGTYCVPESMAKMVPGAGYVAELARLTVAWWNAALGVLDPLRLGRYNPLLRKSSRLDFSDSRFRDMSDSQFMYELYMNTSYDDMRVLMLIGEQILRWDCRDAARAVRAPTLLVHGTEDQFLPVASAEELQGLISGSRLEILEGVHHGLAFQRPEEVNMLMEEYLMRLGY